jgi:cardiolipin synthase C
LDIINKKWLSSSKMNCVDQNNSNLGINQSFSKYLLVCALVAVTSCTSTSPKLALDSNFPAPIAGTDSSCVNDKLNHCAISSPLLDAGIALYAEGKNLSGEHYVTNLTVGHEALILRIHMIRAARKSIELQTYIWANDETGLLIYSELLAAAKRGVKVRIVADQLYSVADPANAARVAVAHENLQVKLYNPLGQKAVASKMDKIRGVFSDFSSLNHRMHNKQMVIDGSIGVAGGRNIENRYFDLDAEFNYLDRDVLVVGPTVDNMVKSFNEYWDDPISRDLYQLEDVHTHFFTDGIQNKFSALSIPSLSGFDELIKSAMDGQFIRSTFLDKAHRFDDVSFIADRPQKPYIKDKDADLRVLGELASVLKSARQSVLMQTPYFVLSGPAYKVFEKLREDNPDINYVVSTNSLASTDHYLVYALSFKRKKRNVKDLGFKIHEMKPIPGDIETLVPRYPLLSQYGFSSETKTADSAESRVGEKFDPVPIEQAGPRFCMHSKTMVIDSETSIIGSHNFDPRSLYINTELTLIIRNKDFAREVEQGIRKINEPQNSWLIAKRQKVPFLGQISGLFASISRILPIFDLWPFRYTTAYELEQGKLPVSTDHPDFYSNYRNVGQFPGTTLGDNQLKTILVSGFGAIAEPQM